VIYEISWYVQHFGRFNFFVRCKNPNLTADQLKVAFEVWWTKFIAGAEAGTTRHLRPQFENGFAGRRIDKVEVIEL
jgi:hypothetical protein